MQAPIKKKRPVLFHSKDCVRSTTTCRKNYTFYGTEHLIYLRYRVARSHENSALHAIREHGSSVQQIGVGPPNTTQSRHFDVLERKLIKNHITPDLSQNGTKQWGFTRPLIRSCYSLHFLVANNTRGFKVNALIRVDNAAKLTKVR